VAGAETPLVETQRIALFGGSFDPLHLGHLAIAQAAADHFALNTVLFAPTGRQPLKAGNHSASFADRLAMVQAACLASGDSRLQASELDAPLPDGTPNFSLRTLTEFSRLYPTSTRFCLVGADSFRSLGHWLEPHALLALAEWIVVSRPGSQLTGPEGLVLTLGERDRIHLLDAVHLDISATDLRPRLAAAEPTAGLLPKAVAEYITAHQLYL
jgi:nicotinate-nucleotide adenylyltransferase